jgi:ribonuclease D
MTTPNLIDTDAGFGKMMDVLADVNLIALDTEADSLFHYWPKVCLIQLSAIAGANGSIIDFLVDPLRLKQLQPLGEKLHAIEVVMHAAENDALLLGREFGFHISNIFDTQLAARILGWPRAGLAAILEDKFGVMSDKRQQRTDWSRRPLTSQQITYAALDTHHLLQLRETQIDELKRKGRWEEALDGFEQLASISVDAQPTEARTFWDMKGVRDVPREQHGLLSALWEWREAEAQRRDIPPFKIANDAVLMKLADQVPTSYSTLQRIQGIGDYTLSRYGDALLRVIRDNRTRRPPAYPPYRGRPESMLDDAQRSRFDALRAWRTQVAEQRGVALDIVLNSATLIEIAKLNPRSVGEMAGVAGMTPWKRSAYGEDILRVLKAR